MFTIIESLEPIVQCLSPAFTQPSFQTQIEVFLGWMMCLGRRTEYGVFRTIQADKPVSRRERHPFDRFYNFFSRSAWTVGELARQVAVAVVVSLNPKGLLYLVVVGLAICIPGTEKIYCLPIHARLHLPGKGQPSEATLAKKMLQDVLQWFPDRKLVLLGDLDERVTHVGVMRSDAAIYDPVPPNQPKSKRGPKPRKGPRLPSPKEAMKKADRNRSGKGPWAWQWVEATAYGVTRRLQVLSFQAVWPKVLGLRPILVVLVRDPEGKFKDTYLFTTDLTADVSWVIAAYARRWSIEVAFKSSKQVMKIEAPQHWCQASIEKLSPWVWLMQSIISLWYLTEGRKLPQARAARRRFGKWDTEWSLAHMLRVLRAAILDQTITPTSATKADLHQLLRQLETYLNLAV